MCAGACGHLTCPLATPPAESEPARMRVRQLAASWGPCAAPRQVQPKPIHCCHCPAGGAAAEGRVGVPGDGRRLPPGHRRRDALPGVPPDGGRPHPHPRRLGGRRCGTLGGVFRSTIHQMEAVRMHTPPPGRPLCLNLPRIQLPNHSTVPGAGTCVALLEFSSSALRPDLAMQSCRPILHGRED